MSKIFTAINEIMKELRPIGKNKTNSSQNFKYRGIDDVMNALQPLLATHGVFVVPEVLEQTREDRQTSKGGNLIYSICKIKYTFYAEDGTNVSATVIGEGMDSGDKATNKAMAIAFKYACFQVFCIPTEEMKDPDADTPEPSIPVLSDAQVKRLYAIANTAGFDNTTVEAQVNKKFGLKPNELSKSQYDLVVQGYEKMKGAK